MINGNKKSFDKREQVFNSFYANAPFVHSLKTSEK